MNGEVPPVIATCRLALLPAHIDVVPESTAAVDGELTVINAVPLTVGLTQPPVLNTEFNE